MAKSTPKKEGAGTVVTGVQYHSCECCTPAQNLFPRPDLGGLVEGTQTAKVALCIFHKPNPTVHIWNEEAEKYVKDDNLKFENQQILNQDGSQAFTAAVPGGAPSLLDLDDEEERNRERERNRTRQQNTHQDDGGSSPQTEQHVNLENDDYY